MGINVESTEVIYTPQEKTFFLKKGECLRLTPTGTVRVNRYISGTLLETRSITEGVTFGAYFSDMSFRIYCQSGNATIEIGDDTGIGVTSAIHPYYHFHGFAGAHTVDDDKFYDLTGLNHAARGANLSVSQLWTTNAGYASTIDPASGTADSVLRIPNLNYDYAAGEKLIIWWLGKVTAEGSTGRMMGDGYGTSAGQWGVRIHLSTTGMLQIVLSDGAEVYSSMSSTSISGRLASFAAVIDGQGKRSGIWVDGAYQHSEGSYSSLGATAIDTRNSNTFNIGTSSAAGAAGTSGMATATRALAILRLPSSYTMPSVGTLTNVFQQLRSNPGKLILASAF